VELLVKLIYFNPVLLGKKSKELIQVMLGYHRYRKTGIFALFCVAL
jgi:hypothetical protein